MEPIINPWLFYLAGVADSITTVAYFLAFAFGIAFLIAIFIFLNVYFEGDIEYAEVKLAKRIVRYIATITIIFTTIYIATPSKTTCYQMLVASQITPDNIEYAKGEVEDIVDYIVEAVDRLNDEDGGNVDEGQDN